jgi:hypothetical protein
MSAEVPGCGSTSDARKRLAERDAAWIHPDAAVRDLVREAQERAWNEGHLLHGPVVGVGDTPCSHANPYAISEVPEITDADSERFWSKVAVAGDDDCWLWTANVAPNGYGCFYWQGRLERSHRWVWLNTVGPIPDGLVIDHRCHTDSDCKGGLYLHRRCVNPRHMELVTMQENSRRAKEHRFGLTAENAAKTHCSEGHEYNEANTYQRPTGGRSCRTCGREWARNAKLEKRAALGGAS